MSSGSELWLGGGGPCAAVDIPVLQWEWLSWAIMQIERAYWKLLTKSLIRYWLVGCLATGKSTWRSAAIRAWFFLISSSSRRLAFVAMSIGANRMYIMAFDLSCRLSTSSGFAFPLHRTRRCAIICTRIPQIESPAPWFGRRSTRCI